MNWTPWPLPALVQGVVKGVDGYYVGVMEKRMEVMKLDLELWVVTAITAANDQPACCIALSYCSGRV